MSKSYTTKWIWLELFSICTCLLGICSDLLMNRLRLICEGGLVFVSEQCEAFLYKPHSCIFLVLFYNTLQVALSKLKEKVIKIKCKLMFVALVRFAYEIVLKSFWLHYWGFRRHFFDVFLSAHSILLFSSKLSNRSLSFVHWFFFSAYLQPLTFYVLFIIHSLCFLLYSAQAYSSL